MRVARSRRCRPIDWHPTLEDYLIKSILQKDAIESKAEIVRIVDVNTTEI